MRRLPSFATLAFACAVVMALVAGRVAGAAPLAEKYLFDGKLTEGATAK